MVRSIVGANWGDEGKGKITDVMAENSDIVVRFQGGANAGHTIINDYGKFALHLLPSGVFHSNIVNVIGPGVALDVEARGDLDVDEHHTAEDVAIALGEAMGRALGPKAGIARSGFALPMDDCRALVLLDFGGRIDFEWDAEFRRERVGDVPTEMFRHFFKSFADAARCNLHITAEGENEHHKIEGVFKAFSRALRMAIARNGFKFELPSSKGVL